MSTFTPLSLLPLPDRSALTSQFAGKNVKSLRTPALIVDRTVFKENSEKVTKEAYKRGLKFRVHVKTHKTVEGTRIQLEAGGGVRAVICSTMVEVWQVVRSGLVNEGKVDDILYSMPIGWDRIEELDQIQKEVQGNAVVRVMVDHAEQIRALEEFNSRTGRKGNWTAFLKVDGGGRRAGAPPKSKQMKELIQAVINSPAVEIFGFYSHFGQSYASDSLDKAAEYYQGEIECVNAAAEVARGLGAEGDWVLSVGATPTAHAATGETNHTNPHLHGELELHAGNYCMCDLQQFATSLVPLSNLALTVVARVVSVYPDRQEAMCDAGALAMSKDTGPLTGFGRVVSHEGWDLGRVSQEHGTLVHRPKHDGEVVEVKIGDTVRIVPQHACLVCAAFPWIYVVEEGKEEVVDVWVPWKGW